MNMFSLTDDDLDWRRIDVQALVKDHGLAVVEENQRESCSRWLRAHDYQIISLDCTTGIETAMAQLGIILRWQEEFGYRLEDGTRNLDALHDGFEFIVPDNRGLVFELYRPDVIWREDARWLLGLLSIASEHSRYHLAFGRRFFTLMVIPASSPLVGKVIETIFVPHPITVMHR